MTVRTKRYFLASMSAGILGFIPLACGGGSKSQPSTEELVCTDGVDNDDDGLTDCDDPDCSQEDICQPAPFTVIDVEVTGDSIDGPQDRTYGGQLNGIVDAGETVFLSPQIRNDSGMTFISLSAQLGSTDPEVYVEPLESFQDYDDIIDGATDRPNSPYVVTFAPEIPDGTLVTFNMALVDSVEGDVGRVSFTLAVRNVAVTGESYVYDDDDIGASSGNGDGRVDPDEQIELRCDILNSGEADLPLVTVPGDHTLLPLLPDNIIVEIESGSPYITILNLDNPPTYTENIPAGASASTPADFDFVVSPQAPSGETVCIRLKLRLLSGAADMYTFRDLTCFLISGPTSINECRDDQDCEDSDPETVDSCDLETGMCLNMRLCGNGVIDAGEECDGGLLAGQDCNSLTGHAQGTLGCSQTCRFDTSGCHTCGDGTAQGPELCDSGDLGGATCSTQAGHTDGILQCNADCVSFDTSGCHTCGDATIDGPEACDGGDLGGQTCASVAGLAEGSLGCNPDCTYDVSDCHTCGNGVVEGNEVCDLGVDLCCNNTCDGPLSVGMQCRASAGDCDPAEFCNGTTTTCPLDLLEPNTTVCRPSAGGCDPPEFCTGTSPTCPNDIFGIAHIGLFAADNAGNHNDVQATLVSTGILDSITVGGPVTTGYTPTLAELQQFGAVFVWGSGSWDGVAFGNVLADYMDAGGGVVIAVFAQRASSTVGVAGRMATDNYLPYVPGNFGMANRTLGAVAVPGHPIMNGVSTFGGPNVAFHDEPHYAPATLVASLDNGRPLIATYQPTVGRSVLLGFYPVSTFWDAGTDGAVLMANALRWAACGP